jgi:hypothetical protein
MEGKEGILDLGEAVSIRKNRNCMERYREVS